MKRKGKHVHSTIMNENMYTVQSWTKDNTTPFALTLLSMLTAHRQPNESAQTLLETLMNPAAADNNDSPHVDPDLSVDQVKSCH